MPDPADKSFADALNAVALTNIVTFAAIVTTFYKALVAEGMPKEYAALATVELLKSKIFGGTPNAGPSST